jgi:hypothetical protein
MNKIWSPSFNLKHSSSDYIIQKRKQTMFSQAQTTSPPTYTTYFPSYWMRRNILDGELLCDPCSADIPANLAEKQLKQYE